MSDRPVVLALVGYFSPVFGLIGKRSPEGRLDDIPPDDVWPQLVTLEEAADFKRGGFDVVVDPQSEAELATWEREQRAMDQEMNRQRRKPWSNSW